jgi:MFS family permease
MSGEPIEVKFILAALGASVNGIGASFLWTSVGSYIHKICHTHHKINMKGHYFGLFNTIFCFSSVLGSIVVTFGLSLFSHSIYFVIVSSVALLAFIYGLLFIKDLKVVK